jgi:phenylalanyl-tRNA synthetase beta chain
VHGYEQLPSVRPTPRANFPAADDDRLPRRRLALALADRGYQEAITYSFVDQRLQALIDPHTPPLELANPLSAELAVMRTSLWPGLLHAYAHNINRQATRVRLFETGLRFLTIDGELRQDMMLAGLIGGLRHPEQWALPEQTVDFYDLKGDVEALLSLTGCVDAFSFVAAEHPALHPGQSARLLRDGRPVGWLGRLHPKIEADLKLMPALVFEIELAALAVASIPVYREVSRFPTVRRDLAVLVPQDLSGADLLATARRACADAAVQDLLLFDVYLGTGVPAGYKSIALGLTLSASERTLTDAEVDQLMARLLQALVDTHQAQLRG